jgi:hypothetical protein
VSEKRDCLAGIKRDIQHVLSTSLMSFFPRDKANKRWYADLGLLGAEAEALLPQGGMAKDRYLVIGIWYLGTAP